MADATTTAPSRASSTFSAVIVPMASLRPQPVMVNSTASDSADVASENRAFSAGDIAVDFCRHSL